MKDDYKVYIYAEKRRLNVTQAVISLETSEQDKQLAASATIELSDVVVDGMRLSDLIYTPDLVYILAYDSEKGSYDEVFRGYIWEMLPKESLTDNTITIKCYDMLIYWQESEDSIFFAGGRTTSIIMDTISQMWGFTLTYDYENITHEKLVLRGCISDFVTADILDTVQKRTGTKYVIRSEKSKVVIKSVGKNEKVYTIGSGKNATELKRYLSMNGVITQVVIRGSADDDGRSPIESSCTSPSAPTFGILQKIITKDEDTDLNISRSEAKSIIAENGEPKWEYDIKAVDIPWIRKGDKVAIKTETLIGEFIVLSVSREISNRGKNMALTVTSL